MDPFAKFDFAASFTKGTGKGVLVAVLDTGVDGEHPAFGKTSVRQAAPQLASPPSCIQEDATDPIGHGTAVAGIIHRLAPEADLLSIRVLQGGPLKHRHELIRLGVEYALSQGASILNCSFGIPATAYTLPIYKEWTDAAFDLGAVVVTASSNHNPTAPEWPSAFRTTLATTDGEMSPTEWLYQGGPIPFVAAGNRIEAPAPGGGTSVLTGSSFAAAHLSGLVARLMSVHPGLTPFSVREILARSVSKR